MSNIIDFRDDFRATPVYQEQLRKNISQLDELETTLNTLAINTATSGKWKEWSDSIPLGGTFYFTEEMLRNTGDENVESINSLIDHIIDIREKLELQLIELDE